MLKKFLFFLSIVILAASCEDKGNPPEIQFEEESVSGIFAGESVVVNGKIFAENGLSNVFWFHQKLSEAGNLDEQTGGKIELASDGSFSIPIDVERTTIGVKIIAQDASGNREVKVFPIILGEDIIEITFEGSGKIEIIDAGEEFQVSGTVASGTPITDLSYTVVKGELTEPAVSLPITGEQTSSFNILLTARTGMTGIRINVSNRGSLTGNKLFEIGHVTSAGPVILFDKESISVKPDSVFIVSGQIVSERIISSGTYTIFRENGSDAPQAFTPDGENKFSIPVTADGKITAVTVTVTDNENKEGEETILVTVLFPIKIISGETIIYKNIILDDKLSRDKSYFSFDVEPYVLNAAQAFANYEKVQLLYTNLFIPNQSYSGPAIFTPAVSQGGTVLAQRLVNDPAWPVSTWGTFNVGRLQAIGAESSFTSATGKTFEELDNLTQEEWVAMNNYLYGTGMGASGIIRQITTINSNGAGWMFRIGWGGAAPASFTRVAVGIVRSFGGTSSTEEGQSTGAWLEIEIKMSKASFR